MQAALKFLTTATMTTLMIAPSLTAQTADDLYSLRGQNDIGITAGVQFTMPLGQKRRSSYQDKARLGLTLSVNREHASRYSGISELTKANLLEIGFWETGDPSLMLYGQDVYRPLFDPLYADEAEETDGPKKKKDNTLLYIAGITGAATIVSVVVLADAVDDFNDCFLQLIDPPDKCRE